MASIQITLEDNLLRGPEEGTAFLWEDLLKRRIASFWEEIRSLGDQTRFHLSKDETYVHDDVVHWMAELPANSVQAIVTDPPYGLVEYEDDNMEKRKNGVGGVWRIPPSFDGVKRAPLPRRLLNSERSAWTGRSSTFTWAETRLSASRISRSSK
jgi:hypothetical protein